MAYTSAAEETNRTQYIDEEMERMRSAQNALKKRLARSELDNSGMNDASDLDLTKWPYGEPEEEGEAEGEEEQKW